MARVAIAYMTLQFKEIDEHKYYLSQKRHKKVDWEEATLDWMDKHAERFNESYASNVSDIERLCKDNCPDGCKGISITADGSIDINSCPMEKSDLHKLLKD